jgi:hypothetical protein
MVTAHAHTFGDRTAQDSLDVRYRGRLIPDRPRKTDAADRVPDIIREKTTASLSDRLADSLWPTLPFVAEASRVPLDRTALVMSYIESLNKLQSLQSDHVHLVTVTCEANLEFRQETGTTNQVNRDKSMGATLDKMVGRAKLPLKPIENILTAEIAALPVEQMQRTLSSALKKAVKQFATQVEAVFQNMAAQRLAGLIEWVGQNACRYHFFKEVVIQENHGSESSSTRTTRPVTDSRGRQRRQLVQKTTTTESGRTIHRWARHEHHVMNAIHTSLANTKVVMPPGPERIKEAIPAWLAPFVRVIDGDLIRERIIECDYHEENWSNVTTREVDLPGYAPDPAIAIDNFILTGWGPREIAAEEQRREELHKSASDGPRSAAAHRECVLWTMASAISALISSLLVGQFGASPVVGVLTLTLSIYAAINAVRLRGHSIGVPSTTGNYASGVIIAFGFLMAGGALSLGLSLHSVKEAFFGVILLAFSAFGLYSLYSTWKREPVGQL